MHSLLKFDSKEKLIWFCYLVVFITEHFTYFANGYLFYLFFVVKHVCSIPFTAMGKVSRADRIVATYDYEWEKLDLTSLYERICEPKVVQIAPRSTHHKSECWITNWQFYWSRSYVRLSLRIRSLYETYTWGYTWRPLACYPFINIKLASYHLLLYVVYLCQKS